MVVAAVVVAAVVVAAVVVAVAQKLHLVSGQTAVPHTSGEAQPHRLLRLVPIVLQLRPCFLHFLV